MWNKQPKRQHVGNQMKNFPKNDSLNQQEEQLFIKLEEKK